MPRLNPQASTVTVHFYGLVHWEDPTDEALGPVPCHCSPPEGAVTKEGMLHYKAGTSYLGKEHWKTCFVVLRWEPRSCGPRGGIRSLAREAQGQMPPFPTELGGGGRRSVLRAQDSQVPEPALVTDLQLCPGRGSVLPSHSQVPFLPSP